MVTNTSNTTLQGWSGIEHSELDSKNWVQMAFRWHTVSDEAGNHESVRVYKVFGEIRGEAFYEDFYSDSTTQNKDSAYDFYWDKEEILDNECIYCVDCGEYARNPEFALAVSQTGGYCLDCAPDPDDEKAIRWL